MIYTSGTTSDPKAAILRHSHLSGYVVETVEFGASSEDESTLVSLPPYHIAGLMSLLTNTYAGRRVHLLPKFDSETWIEAVEQERITHATVVPTMLARLLTWVGTQKDPPELASLQTLASGGAKLSVPVARKVLELWPRVGLVNGYGLTETSSTVSVMDPESYREDVR